jgi:ABC-2 type transport system ATP-binding protein
MTDGDLIAVNNLAKQYNSHAAVRGVTFTVRSGEVFGLLGPNGAGKTTTISMLSCLLEPSAGDAWVAGHSVRAEPMAVRRAIGVVPQEIALYPTLTARENLRFWARMYEVPGGIATRRVEEVLDIVGLRDRAGERIDTYSGGMKRRINIAVGLLHRPRLLMLDEPTVGVDPQSRTNILETVKQLNRAGLTVLYTSHYMEEVEFLCDRIAIMDLGRIIAMGTQKELRLQVGERDLIRISTHTAQLGTALPAVLRGLPGVDDLRVHEDRVEVLTATGRTLLPQIVTQFVQHDVPILAIEVKEPNLESLFLQLTGKHLRD